jgi:hypothetical protein
MHSVSMQVWEAAPAALLSRSMLRRLATSDNPELTEARLIPERQDHL